MLPGYLILMLKHSRLVRDQIARLTTQAAGRLLVNTQTLARLTFPVPSLQDQGALVELAERLRSNIDLARARYDESRHQLGLIRDKLLIGGQTSV
jgi:restriction endonuclease S subunit